MHGRTPDEGLDCVGLAAWALAGGGWRGEVPSGYRLRGGDPRRVAAFIEGFGLAPVAEGHAGDVMLACSGPGQLHLAILTDTGFVHADAMLRRVVERPGAVPWPVVGSWRLVRRASQTSRP